MNEKKVVNSNVMEVKPIESDVTTNVDLAIGNEMLVDPGFENTGAEEKSEISDMVILTIVIVVCVVIGIALGILAGKRSANK